ncbi:MAG: hypothetical protein ACOZQL_11140 [Myxococcota bacterium]
MGAGFGMMLPGMLQQAMAQQGAQPGVQPPPPQQPAAAKQPAAAQATVVPAAGAAAFADLAPAAAPPAADPREVVRSVVQSAGYTLDESGPLWQVIVPLSATRKQAVRIDFGQKDSSGNPVVAFWSVCGPSVERNAMALLRYNANMLLGAFALRQVGQTEMVVLQATELAEMMSALDVSRLLSAIAWQADQVEQKLSGADEH